METRETTEGTRTNLSTLMTDLTCHKWTDFHNFNSDSVGFVSDEALQLEETPVANPIVHSPASMSFPDSFQIFQDNLVSIKIGNDVFAYVMINPSHEPLLSARNLPKKSLGRLCAFGLKNRTQMLELPLDLLDLTGIEKSAVRSDGKIIYSEVNAKNFVLSRVSDINFFGKCEYKITSAFSINQQKAFCNFPTKVFFVAVRNSEWYLNSAFNCAYAQNIVFEGSTTGEIVSHRTSAYDRLGLSFLDNSTSLFDTGNSQLALQSFIFDVLIDKRMKLDIIPNFSSPSLINTELETFLIQEQSPIYFRSSLQFDFNAYPAQHTNTKQEQVFKYIASHPTAKAVGVRSEVTL